MRPRPLLRLQSLCSPIGPSYILSAFGTFASASRSAIARSIISNSA